MPSFSPLPRAFYQRPVVTVARECLGKLLVWQEQHELLAARIVEVEAYLGVADRAAHSYGGRRTRRNEVMYGPAGHAYVFMIYGLHYHLNFVTDDVGHPNAVLLRAVEPVVGEERMRERRHVHRRELLTSGPGRVCQAFGIDLRCNGLDLVRPPLYLAEAPPPARVVRCRRVGVDYAGPWAKRLLRFVDPGSRFLSRHPR